MRVLVSLEHRFQRTPDGAVWTTTNNAYNFWTRYLDVFSEVNVMARVRDVSTPGTDWVRADGAQVSFAPIPHFLGPAEYARSAFQVKRAIHSALNTCQAVIMRVPSTIGNVLTSRLIRKHHPFGLEVVGDPYDVFAPGAGVRHPLRPVFRKLFTSNLRRQCHKAQAVAYVTEHALQRRYPAPALMVGISDVQLPAGAFVTSYSSVELSSAQVLSSFRDKRPTSGQAVLVFIGSLEQLYKAPDVLIRATSKSLKLGLDLRLRIVGDGQYRPLLEQMVSEMGLTGHCEFLGQLPGGNAVQQVLDTSDVFVLPSRVEGLPRAMIEAMARGLPCIGSTIGGIPELLEDECMVRPGDVDGLATKIVEVVSNPERQIAMGLRNIARAKDFSDETLRSRRIDFYRHVADFTATALQIKSDMRDNAAFLQCSDS